MKSLKWVDHYIEQSTRADFQLSQIRKELKIKNIPEEEIKLIIRFVDDAIQKRDVEKMSNSRARDLIVAGSILLGLDVVITLGTYTGLIPMGNHFLISYGGIFFGGSLISAGYAMKKKQKNQ